MATTTQPDLATQMLHGLLQAGLDSLPQVSPLDMVPAEERRGRVDVLASQVIAQTIEASGNPVAQAVYQKVKPLLDTALQSRLGPKRKGAPPPLHTPRMRRRRSTRPRKEAAL